MKRTHRMHYTELLLRENKINLKFLNLPQKFTHHLTYDTTQKKTRTPKRNTTRKRSTTTQTPEVVKILGYLRCYVPNARYKNVDKKLLIRQKVYYTKRDVNMKKRLLFIVLFFICGLFATIVYPVLAFGYGDNSWQTKAPMSQARTGLGVAVVDGKIYAIGGYTEHDDDVPVNGVGTNERYDPETDTWITLTPMPTPRGNFAIAAYEGKIYCIGGYDRGNIYATSIKDFVVNEVYDTVTDSWSTKADAPSFSITQANVVDGKIFAIKYSTLYIYDPVADSWTNKTGLPIGGYVSAVIDSKIVFSFNYYPNGIAEGRPTEIVMIYNPKSDTYSEASAPPSSYVSRITSVAIATTGVYAPQRIYILGLKHELFKSNTVYDPINDTWLTAKALPAYRDGFGVAVVDDVIYVIGGQRRTLSHLVFFIPLKAVSTNQQYIPIGYNGYVATTNPLLNYYSIAGLTLTIGITTCSLFFYLKKRKND